MPLLFVPCSSYHNLGCIFHLTFRKWGDACCDVVAYRGRCHRWSPPWGCDSSKMCLLACVYARAHQQFCTFCFHNLHTCLLFCPSLRIEMRELQQKTWEFFQQISHVFQIISDLLLHISDFLQNSHSFHEKLIVLCRSTFCSFSSLLPPLFLYFLSLQRLTLKECL